ncbi:MAG: cysteine desulfurase family protein [Actinomycetia bacterium]|nr:cysteine desulfurase family protein [Actinomycetes bacterium]
MPASTHYLDHAATTPMVAAARAALVEHAGSVGNPSSLHADGRRARAVVETAREEIAAVLGAHPSEVVFTSGGTEADNIAITGTYAARIRSEPRARGVVTSSIEHHAVLETAEALRPLGAAVRLVPPDDRGTVTADQIGAALHEIDAAGSAAALVSVMWANNEIGTIQPVQEIAEVAHRHGAIAHSDAVQAAGPCSISFSDSGLDLMSVSAHKLGGPMGVGVLLASRSAPTEAIVHGGGHERGLRSGTVPVALVAACAAAISDAAQRRTSETPRLIALRDRLIQGALDLDLGIAVGGAWTPGSAHDRLPGNAHLIVPGCEPDSLLFLLDSAGIAASTGSACQAGVPGGSHVLTALGFGGRSVGVVRLTLGHTSTDADVDAALSALATCVPRARSASGVSA